MGWTSENLTHEQQELLDSGLRMLAHMIVETHLRRTAIQKKDKCVTVTKTEHPGPSRSVEEDLIEDQSESNDE